MNSRILKFIKVCALSVGSALAITLALSTASVAAEPLKTFDIPAQSLSEALADFSRQSDVIIFAPSELTKGKTSGPVEGELELTEALETLLDGTGLNYTREADGGFIIRALAKKQSRKRVNSPRKLAQVQPTEPPEKPKSATEEVEKEEEEIEEIIVTGSHIRGVGPVGSQVLTFDREDIDIQGYSTLPQFIQSLPQNFNGGISESTDQFSFANDAFNNINGGTGVNLRGLGNVSTLVLLNGQRLAPTGLNGSFVDISMIPLSAIGRVEILTDGASAIYGSDAISGVMNFILRKDYDGAETRLRYGLATEGGLEEFLVGQTFGKTWKRGYGLISYEYSHRDNLDTRDRSFSKDAPVPNDLLPEQSRHSFFLTGGQNLTDKLEVFTTAFYSERNSERNNFLNLNINPAITSSETKQYGGTLGTELDLDSIFGNGWRAEVIGNYSRSEVIQKTRFQDEVDSDSRVTTRASDSLSVDAKLDGSIFQMAGGAAKLAIGGQFRHETFGDLDLSVDPALIRTSINDFSRDVYAVFGEVYLPFVDANNRMSGVERLEFSISARYEHYSDFGSSTNPKFGVLWSPVEGLDLRGTWGTSFRAPLLRELDESDTIAILFNSIPNDMSPTGTSLLLFISGTGNINIQPETASLWTAGFDFQPAAISGLNVSLTYFNIDYEDRITFPIFNFFTVLNDPKWANIIDFDGPDADDFARIENFQQFNFTFFPGFGPPAEFADAEVLLDGILQNQARQKTTGLDFSVSYGLDTENSGSWNFSLNGTYLFKFLEQVTALDSPIDGLGLINHPVALRMNGNVSWAHKGFTTNLSVNYVDSYVDDRTTTAVPVKSWTTANLTISYNTGDIRGLFGNTVFTLSAVNLFDQDPPFLDALRANTNIFFDASAASPAGRVLSFQITKQW